MKAAPVKHKLLLLNLVLTALLTLSCSAKTPAQEKLGADSDYFAGLTLLREGNQKEAINKFRRCVKKGTYYCARASAAKLCEFGSLQEKNEACINLLEKFNDSENLLLASKHFLESNEISKIIEYTSSIKYETENNELIRLRLEALNRRGDNRYQSEVYKWFTCRQISQEHYQFYRDYYIHPDFEVDEIDLVECFPEQFAINYRIELYKRNYTFTYTHAKKIIEWFESGTLEPNQQLASDIGKSYLYGSMQFANNGQLFRNYAQTFKGTPIEFYFWFYAGRLYDKGGIYTKLTKRSFESAIETATTPDQKDNALWYLLNSSLTTSLDTIISSIGNYASQWSNGSYFDDFFETLLSSLLVSGKWNAFYDIYTAIDGHASNEIVAQYAYIYGRLIEEGLLSEEAIGRNAESAKNAAFTRALKCDSKVYYKILAANRLHLPENQFEIIMADTGYSPVAAPDPAAEKILKGCVLLGYPEMIYPLWLELYPKGVSTDTAFYIADFLNKCSNGEDDYYQQSLRIASRAAAITSRPLKKEELKLVYPQNYMNFIDTSCKKYDIKESVVLALIRSESFFDPDVESSAGAVGLTQLMELTSGDIARKLKYRDYSLEDPQTNIDFGTFYLSELIRRCDGSYLQAFFAYNAGITRVRRWLQSSLVEFGKKKDMPLDLFLETVPYEETREYGRKLISAGFMYEWLYDESNTPFGEIVNTFVK